MKPRSTWQEGVLLLLSLAILLGGMAAGAGSAAAAVAVVLSGVAVALLVYRWAPQILQLGRKHPKLKTVRRLVLGSLGIIAVAVAFVLLEPILQQRLGAYITRHMEYWIAFGILGGFMLFFGNAAPKIPYNRYIGLRLPWTVTDEPTWRMAHRMIGWLCWPCGLLQLAVGALVPVAWVDAAEWRVWVLLLPFLVWLLAPSLGSLLFFCRRWRIGPAWLYIRKKRK